MFEAFRGCVDASRDRDEQVTQNANSFLVDLEPYFRNFVPVCNVLVNMSFDETWMDILRAVGNKA